MKEEISGITGIIIVIGLRKYSVKKLQEIIEREDSDQLSYSPTGMAKSLEAPPQYHANHQNAIIGHGRQQFKEAQQIMQRLDHLDWKGIDVFTSSDQLDEEVYIISQSRFLGLWGLAVSRVTEIIENDDENILTFGYVMGTTQYHVLQGEEAFLLQYDRKTEDIHYTVYSYSKPNGILLTLGTPFIRIQQRRFAQSAVQYLQSCLEDD